MSSLNSYLPNEANEQIKRDGFFDKKNNRMMLNQQPKYLGNAKYAKYSLKKTNDLKDGITKFKTKKPRNISSATQQGWKLRQNRIAQNMKPANS